MNMKKKFSLLTYIQNHSLQVNLQMEHVMQQALKILNIYILVPFTFIDFWLQGFVSKHNEPSNQK